MEDEKGSQPIEQQPQTQGANIPPPENGPTGENSAQVRNQNEDDRIANLEDKMRSAERIMAGLTGAIAVFALFSVIVALLQWEVMNGQLKEMHDGGVDTHNLAMATKDAADLNRILAEGSAAAWLMPSAQELNRNFLSFGVQNMGGIAAGNVGVSVKVELTRLSNSQTLWTESFTFDTVKYLPPKQNTNGQAVLTISKYTRQDFERITKEQEVLIKALEEVSRRTHEQYTSSHQAPLDIRPAPGSFERGHMSTPAPPPEPETSVTETKSAPPNASTPSEVAPGFQSLTPLIESISKVAAGFLITAYVSGYLIVSIYDSSFGFTELNPLKPKILGAGILFSVLTAIAFYASHLIYSRPSTREGRLRKIDTYLARTVSYLWACLVATNGLSLMISERNEPQPLLKAPALLAPLFHVGTPSLLFFVITLPLFVLSIDRFKVTEKYPSISVTAALLLLTMQTADYLFRSTAYNSTWIALWLFGAGLVLRPLAIMALNPQRRRTVNWTTQLFLPISALFFFSRWVYPKIRASWGGGQPVPVVLYLTKDSPLRPGASYPVLLLDESDAGFYFVEQPRSKAVFIPRGQVSMIFFSDSPVPTSSTEKPNPATSQPASASPTPEKTKP